ncbi:MAG: 2-deoxyglucose-6-phosphatase [Acidimicrobiaceae bacterium]|nr:2-deoxyglucose-6-phosphatase [Acidimicrobiaceae bacterium]
MQGPVPAPRTPVTAVIFDMDGLLVDSEPLWREAQVGVLDKLGSDVRAVLERGLVMGMRVDEAVALFRSWAPWEGADDEAVARDIVQAVVASISEHAVLMPGALEALDLFQERGLLLALASGSVPEVVDAVVDRFKLRDRFTVIASAVDDRLGKPHPAIFLRTAAALGAPAADCVVLEDSVNGCIAAKAARMRVIAVPSASDLSDPRFAVADLVLGSLEELKSPAAFDLLGLA